MQIANISWSRLWGLNRHLAAITMLRLAAGLGK
jgi:hypothetical protein